MMNRNINGRPAEFTRGQTDRRRIYGLLHQNSERYSDPTAGLALQHVAREDAEARAAENAVYTGPDSIPLMTRVLNPDGTVNDYRVPERLALGLYEQRNASVPERSAMDLCRQDEPPGQSDTPGQGAMPGDNKTTGGSGVQP